MLRGVVDSAYRIGNTGSCGLPVPVIRGISVGDLKVLTLVRAFAHIYLKKRRRLFKVESVIFLALTSNVKIVVDRFAVCLVSADREDVK